MLGVFTGTSPRHVHNMPTVHRKCPTPRIKQKLETESPSMPLKFSHNSAGVGRSELVCFASENPWWLRFQGTKRPFRRAPTRHASQCISRNTWSPRRRARGARRARGGGGEAGHPGLPVKLHLCGPDFKCLRSTLEIHSTMKMKCERPGVVEKLTLLDPQIKGSNPHM